MSVLIGGGEAGLLDSSLLLLGRDDRTREGEVGAGHRIYLNVSTGNLTVENRDTFLSNSQTADYDLVRTYNSQGRLGEGQLITYAAPAIPGQEHHVRLIWRHGNHSRG